jgi:hypothetical protein
MKIDVDHDEKCPIISQVYSGAFLETSEGNRIGFCMRDDTIEFTVIPKGSDRRQGYRVNMQTLEVDKELTNEDDTVVRDTEPVHNAG